MEDVKYNFYAITPIDDADINVYESAFNFIFNHNNVRNVAVSGSYGAGKSSVLASYKKKHGNIKFLHISLAHFRSANKNEDIINDAVDTTTEIILEGKILNQLIHQISPDSIPCTNFRVKKEISKKKNIFTASFAAIGIILGFYIFLFTQWTDFVQSFTFIWLKNLFWFSEQPESRFIAGLIFCIVMGVFAHRFIKLQESRHIIRRADVSGVEIEIFEDSNESYFDKYLNEVLYLFENANADVIVFEDIDRYDSSGIFERLHEINTLINSDRKGQPLRFLYLMRDDIFVSKDRTKFFDFIIPIVPVVDASNSYNKFIECFQKSGLIGDENTVIDHEFLQGLSLYIDDMRILQNICNEFLIYHGRLTTTDQNPNKMLALIAVKNLFPRDFADLQLGRGFMFEVIGGHGKERLTKSEKDNINKEIEENNKELESLKNELLPSDDIAILYYAKLYSTIYRYSHQSFSLSDNPQTCKQKIEDYRDYLSRSNKILLDEYDKRMEVSTENDTAKATKISALETKIDGLKAKKIKLAGLRLKDIITRDNVKNLFEARFKSETGNSDSDFAQIKDSPYFDLLKFLVREGFIDETYSDYMTYFYENSLTRTDKVFLRSVTDKKAKEATYGLDNSQMIVSRLPLAYFEQEETLNYALFKFLLNDYTSNREFVDKAIKIIQQLIKNERYDFILGLFEQTDCASDIVEVFGKEWVSFLSDFFIKMNIGKSPTNPKTKNDIFITKYAYALLTLIGEKPHKISNLDESSKKKLITYLSNDADFLSTDKCNDNNVAIGIQQLDIFFKAIKTETARKTLFKLIYINNSYVINYENIETMLKSFYLNADIASLQTANYSVIMTETDSPLSKYINNNISQYMEVVLAKCNKSIIDTPNNVISLLNNPDVDFEKKLTYISYMKTTISNILDITDKDLWSTLLKNQLAIEYSASNIVNYFSAKCDGLFDDIIVQYINSKGTIVTFDDNFKNDNERRSVFSAIVKSTSLNNHIYKGYLEQFDLMYPEFKIPNLSYDKLKILDELDKIKMSLEALLFMREHYKDYLYPFIVRHVTDYTKVVSETKNFLHDELLNLLNTDITDSVKITLLQLDEKPISIKSKNYSDIVATHILLSNYDMEDLSYILKSYMSFGTQTKSAILEIATNQIKNVLLILEIVDRQLILALFSSDNIIIQDKQIMFRTLALASVNVPDSEIKKWLPHINGNNFLALYDGSKRPRFENNEWNKIVLEIFKGRGLIKDYSLSEQHGKLIITRWKNNKTQKGFFE